MKKTAKQTIASSVTQKDIAKRAGVSSTVVSYVINNGPRPVAESTRQRVLKAIEELGYRPNKHAQSLKSKTDRATRQIGIVLGESEMLKRPYYGDILAGIYAEAYRQGQRIRFLHFFNELHDTLLFSEHIHPEEISALIFFVPKISLRDSRNQKLLQRILDRIDNIVCLERAIADQPAVIFDQIDAARTAAMHLIALGHKRIGFIGYADERTQGYRQAVLEHNLEYDDTLVVSPGVLNLPQEGYKGVLQMLAMPTPPTAILAASDEVAIGAAGALFDQGVNIPQDIALVSIDDIDIASAVRPALTTVRVPRREMGELALRILAMHTAYPDTQPTSTILRTELIIRQSCGAKQ